MCLGLGVSSFRLQESFRALVRLCQASFRALEGILSESKRVHVGLS